MKLPPRRTRAGLALALACAPLALFAAACGDDGGGSSEADVISAITIMDRAGLHDIDESINTKKEVPATARTTAIKMQTVALLTEWPTKDLESDAKTLAAAFKELADVLDAEKPDLAKAGAAAKKAHDVQHDFSDHVGDHLKGKAGVAAKDGDHD